MTNLWNIVHLTLEFIESSYEELYRPLQSSLILGKDSSTVRSIDIYDRSMVLSEFTKPGLAHDTLHLQGLA